jgi:putative ABC transport system permease protein
MPALTMKLLRDCFRLSGLILASALVLGAGIALYVMASGTLDSLTATRAAYYERQGLADVSAIARRVPQSTLPEIAGIPGVARAEGRVTGTGRITVKGFAEPVNAILHSLPDDGRKGLNAVALVQGRLPDPTRTDEVLVNTAFARVHGLKSRDVLPIVVRGMEMRAMIVGTAEAPDHVYTLAPGSLTNDDRRLAIVWLPRRALEGPMDQLGAFNEALLTLLPGTEPRAVIAHLDRILKPWGGTGAIARADTLSDRFLTSEMDQLGTMARILPPMFLAVAAFLIAVMIGRLIATQREQIGLLKAFGFTDGEVARHYAGLALLVAALGVSLGGLGGALLGRGITTIYAHFYQFPLLLFRIAPETYVTAALIGGLAALLGAAWPILSAARLSPATAMSPPAPPSYVGRASEALSRLRFLDSPGLMLLRHLFSRPWRAALGAIGIGLAAGLAIVASFNVDAIGKMLDVTFNQAARQQATLVLAEVRASPALDEIRGLPGVIRAEPYRAVPARLVHGQRSWREAVTGVPGDGHLYRLIDTDLKPVAVPPRGILLSQTLADKLGASVGSLIRVEILDGRQPVLTLRVSQVVKTYQGTPAFMDLHSLNEALEDTSALNGAWISFDPAAKEALIHAVEERPMIAGMSLRSAVIGNFREQVEQNLAVFRLYSLAIASVIVIGVVYNNGRLAYSEQVRDLATMRVLGYGPASVGFILVGELLLLALFAIPIGILSGLGLAAWLARAFSSDIYSIPFVVAPATIAMSLAVMLAAAIVTSFLMMGRVRRLDLVRVLKGRE